MARTCEICGGLINVGAGICQSCGTPYKPEGYYDNLVFGNPRWGIIAISMIGTPQAEQRELLDALKEMWVELEVNTFQKLAPSQVHRISTSNLLIEVAGPYSTYVLLNNKFEGRVGLAFLDKTHAELDDLFLQTGGKNPAS